eukprot:5929150-Amphidinium_carterae.1
MVLGAHAPAAQLCCARVSSDRLVGDKGQATTLLYFLAGKLAKFYLWGTVTQEMIFKTVEALQVTDLKSVTFCKFWQPGYVRLQRLGADAGSAWTAGTLRDISCHCPEGKALGADRWCMN